MRVQSLRAFCVCNTAECPRDVPSDLAEKKKKKSKEKDVGSAQVKEDFQIQPEKITPTLDTSDWPLLLKVCSSPRNCSRPVA